MIWLEKFAWGCLMVAGGGFVLTLWALWGMTIVAAVGGDRSALIFVPVGGVVTLGVTGAVLLIADMLWKTR